MRTCCIALVVLILMAACGSGGNEFEAKIALRYATQEDHTVLLEVAPLQVGANRLRITEFGGSGQALPSPKNATVKLSRLESKASSRKRPPMQWTKVASRPTSRSIIPDGGKQK